MSCALPGADKEQDGGIVTATHIDTFDEATATEQIGTDGGALRPVDPAPYREHWAWSLASTDAASTLPVPEGV